MLAVSLLAVSMLALSHLAVKQNAGLLIMCEGHASESSTPAVYTPPRSKTKDNFHTLHRTPLAIGEFGLCSFILVLRMTKYSTA